jgi:hypothetical protein
LGGIRGPFAAFLGPCALFLTAVNVVHLVLPGFLPVGVALAGACLSLMAAGLLTAAFIPGARMVPEGPRSAPPVPETNPYPIVEMEHGGRLTFANQAARRLFPRLEEMGFAHPWLQGLDSLLGAGTSSGTASRDWPHDGRRYRQDIFVVGTASRRLRVYGSDVTELKRAQSKEHENANILSNLIESTTDSFFIKDRQAPHGPVQLRSRTGPGQAA